MSGAKTGPGFTSFSQFLELGRESISPCKYSGSQACVLLCAPQLSSQYSWGLVRAQEHVCHTGANHSLQQASGEGSPQSNEEETSGKAGNRCEGSSMEGRGFQTLSQKDMMRGFPCALERKYWMQHNPRTGKGAVHQLRVSHNCKMQISCLERRLPTSTAA